MNKRQKAVAAITGVILAGSMAFLSAPAQAVQNTGIGAYFLSGNRPSPVCF